MTSSGMTAERCTSCTGSLNLVRSIEVRSTGCLAASSASAASNDSLSKCPRSVTVVKSW
ncbi:hypothetical protein FHR33_007664 [Nonomuraea dietziae]|uniref:Uncharacterized protein n=1 Tax=Nonomuraea dietziae TaxID=65515 RepID=A0A7W5V9D3_9ACTN|nr:hypothetical protein [Nonomuraea dietziae]MBB3731804.1 hypothetical protein [Nonomuraea dietziae]